MTKTQLRQQLNSEIDRLSPEDLAQLLELARQLRQARELKPDIEYAMAWSQWFEQVDRLEISTDDGMAENPSDYSTLIVEKYR
ncbi:MAG: hypothetical protein GDA56_16310 [Hormoscilla sp. GM7CHS1pb]|nr:hypothetical protein [Hormoscilla sp. GM7CHS1pb]